MALILDGKKARDFYTAGLMKRIAALPFPPKLAILQVGDNEESNTYIGQKMKFAHSIGVRVERVSFSESENERRISEKIKELNNDENLHGIIVQLPLPLGLDRWKVINFIDPKKDVDGLTDENQRLLEAGSPRFVPATAKGVLQLLDFHHIDVQGKTAVVFGRSRLVGHPIAELLKWKGSAVTVCHTGTENPKSVSKSADIIIVAIGKPEFIDAAYVKKGAIVIDVGINSNKGKLEEEVLKRKIVGDVKFAEVEKLASALSPVPGGVGPMTVLSLFDNLIVSAERAHSRAHSGTRD